MPCCYIIYSHKLVKFYIGASHVDFDIRLSSHNSHKYGKNHFTSKADDWSLFIIIEVLDFSHAVRIERKIKSMKSSKYILNLKKYKELVEKLILQTM